MIQWSVKGGGVIGPAPFLIVGIVNITPDSFFDGGKYNATAQATAHAALLLDQGAHILDLGGESTRPFAEPVEASIEISRVMPVMKQILEAHPDANISVDTYKARVAKQCLQSGAVIINDISACSFDPELLDVLVEHKPGYVLMHALDRPEKMQNDPRYDNVIKEILSFFEKKLNQLVRAGLPEDRIVLDPGIGFGKTLEHNLEILKNIERFKILNRPLYLGLSYKSAWGKLLGLELKQRGLPSQVAVALMAAKNVRIHRVHDVQLTGKTLKMVEAICS